ncbi:MAG: response regulator [Elusimicrobia bacterium]|nr:response regulator [Elusimicrobiota bacterium]
MRILIVDDEEGVRDVCERALRLNGHEVSCCASGEDALPRLGEPWDLVLTDLTMSGKVDGNEVLRRARAAGEADVVLMTVYPSLDSTIAAVKDGACDYLLKPFSLGSLKELVRRREESRRQARRPRQTIARFLSPQIAEHVLQAADGAAERREIRMATILFADVRRFTPFTELVGPEDAASQLDEMLACLIEAVQTEGGSINKFMGDGAMALFGAPRDHKEPAAAAARAALRARAATQKLGRLEFGFGINSGPVAAGCLGNAQRAEYSVIGSAVNIASRLEEAAHPGQILIGPGVYAALDERFVCAPARLMEFPGVGGPLFVSELVRIR